MKECNFDNAHHPRICMTHLEETGKDHAATLCTHAVAVLMVLLRDVLAEGSLNYSTEARLRDVLGEGRGDMGLV